ncbi:MAG: hypothetical protein AAB444_03680 [Patescibacteria group bacterium]
MEKTIFGFFILLSTAYCLFTAPVVVFAANEVVTTPGLGGAGKVFQETAKGAGFIKPAEAPEVVVGRYIQSGLIMMGTIFGLLVVYAGYLWMTARGNAEFVTKAKDILINASIGIVIVMGAYAVTSFVVNRVIEAASFGSPPPTE